MAGSKHHLIVCLSLLRILQNLVGLIDLLELLWISTCSHGPAVRFSPAQGCGRPTACEELPFFWVEKVLRPNAVLQRPQMQQVLQAGLQGLLQQYASLHLLFAQEMALRYL